MARILTDLVRVFALLSLLSFGGGSGILAEMQRQVVSHGWASPREFLDIYAIARAAPGPGMQMVALIGWHAAGWLGALVASAAMYLPSSLLVYLATRTWGRLPESRTKQAVQEGLATIAVGLTFASVLTLLQTSDNPLTASLTAIVCAAILMATKVNPLLPLTAAGVLYFVVG